MCFCRLQFLCRFECVFNEDSPGKTWAQTPNCLICRIRWNSGVSMTHFTSMPNPLENPWSFLSPSTRLTSIPWQVIWLKNIGIQQLCCLVTYCGRNIKPCTGQFKAKVSCKAQKISRRCLGTFCKLQMWKLHTTFYNFDTFSSKRLTTRSLHWHILGSILPYSLYSCKCTGLAFGGFRRAFTSCSINASRCVDAEQITTSRDTEVHDQVWGSGPHFPTSIFAWQIKSQLL